MILTKLYPNNETSKEITITSSIAGGSFYLFLIIYQPFGTNQFEHAYKYLMLFPYAIIATVSFCSVNILIAKCKKKWTIGLELTKISLILFLISTLSYLYNSLFLSTIKLSFVNYCYMFLYVSAVGLPISFIYILARYIYLNKKSKSVQMDNMSIIAKESVKAKYKRSTLIDDKAKKIHSELDSVMQKEKLYKDAELTIAVLAKRLSIHPNLLSEVINTIEHKIFSDYINEYRVKEFKKIILLPENRNFTMLAVAFECGFNSKASFNRNFKKIMQLSPSCYLKQQGLKLANK